MSNPDCNRKLLEVNKRHTNILTRISQLVDYINQFELLKEKVKIEMNLGDEQFPAIFSYAIFNQTISVNRTIIAPAKYLRKCDKKFNLSNVNNNQYILMKITDLENLNFKSEDIKNNNTNTIQSK